MNISQIKRKHISGMLEFCFTTFGYSLYQPHYPIIKIDYNNKLKGMLGEYDGDENTISINLKYHKSVVELCSTVIHEFIHYLQNMDRYNKLYKKVGYNDHPFEIEATELSNHWKKECRNFIKNL